MNCFLPNIRRLVTAGLRTAEAGAQRRRPTELAVKSFRYIADPHCAGTATWVIA